MRPLYGHEANNFVFSTDTDQIPAHVAARLVRRNEQLFGPVLLVSNVKRLKRPRTLSSSLAVTFIDYVIHFVVFFADSGTTCSLLVAHCKDS